jgi:hypothetical protein
MPLLTLTVFFFFFFQMYTLSGFQDSRIKNFRIIWSQLYPETIPFLVPAREVPFTTSSRQRQLAVIILEERKKNTVGIGCIVVSEVETSEQFQKKPQDLLATSDDDGD